MPATVSILIVNWRSKDYVRRCLQTVRETSSQLVRQIIVVDGGSFDDCGKMLAIEFPEVEFVQSPDNVGFGRSNNLGFERVNQPVLLLLNPDTELRPGALAQMLEVLEKHENAGIVSPRLLNSDGTLQMSSVMAFPTPLNQALRADWLMKLWPRSRLWGAGEAYTSDVPVAVEAVSGACMLLRTELFRRLGGFRPEFFMYAEDMDLCLRAHRLGFVNYHVPRAEVLHHGGGSSRTQVSQFSTVTMRDSTATYMRLNHGRATLLCYRFLQGLSAATRLLLVLPTWLVRRGESRMASKITLTKWWYVLKWALGSSSLKS
jgi:GT2 family glycosyltransferase